MKTLTQLTIKALKGFEAIEKDFSAEIGEEDIEAVKIYAAEGCGAFNRYSQATFVIEFSVNGAYEKGNELLAIVGADTERVELRNRAHGWNYIVEVRD